MKDDLILTLHEEAPITLNAELIKQMTTIELVKLWKVSFAPSHLSPLTLSFLLVTRFFTLGLSGNPLSFPKACLPNF